MDGLHKYIRSKRIEYTPSKPAVRIVYMSELGNTDIDGNLLSHYIADRTPLFYRQLSNLIDSFKEGYFLTPIKTTLQKLPTSQSFQESHFGEITAAIFAQEAIGLRQIYSKLSLLSTENSNAYKMDLIFYDPNSDPLTFIFAEVKSSPKVAKDGQPAGHDKSCYADIFNSMNHYSDEDLDFDLQAAKDHLDSLPSVEQDKLRKVLLPYSDKCVKYAGFAIIDSSTMQKEEISVLATRKNNKDFTVDVICVQDYPSVADSVFTKLDALRQLCSQ